MSFELLKQDLAKTVSTTFGEAVYYKSKTGTEFNLVDGILYRDHEKNPGASLTGISEKITAVDIPYQQVSNPKSGDFINVGTEEFTVSEVLDNNHTMVRLQVR